MHAEFGNPRTSHVEKFVVEGVGGGGWCEKHNFSDHPRSLLVQADQYENTLKINDQQNVPNCFQISHPTKISQNIQISISCQMKLPISIKPP